MPFDPDCTQCQGTGWREVQRGGLNAVERCGCGRSSRSVLERGIGGLPERYRRTNLGNFKADWCGDPTHLNGVVRNVESFVANFFPFDGQGLLLRGNSGVGKTHLAVGAGKLLCEKGYEVAFFDYQSLLQRIRDSYDPAAAGSASKRAYRAALDAQILILDDLGAHRVTDWVRDTVTQIITHRYNEKKTIIATTNCPIRSLDGSQTGSSELRDSLEDCIGERASSRIFEMCRVIKITASDYRLHIQTRSGAY